MFFVAALRLKCTKTNSNAIQFRLFNTPRHKLKRSNAPVSRNSVLCCYDLMMALHEKLFFIFWQVMKRNASISNAHNSTTWRRSGDFLHGWTKPEWVLLMDISRYQISGSWTHASKIHHIFPFNFRVGLDISIPIYSWDFVWLILSYTKK